MYLFPLFGVHMRIPFTHKTILFVTLVFMCLSFLIFQSGVRAYLDASYQFNMANDLHNFGKALFDITWYTRGGDRSQIISARYIQMAIEIWLKSIFWIKWWAIVLYLSYFCINYFFSEKIFAKFIDREHAYIGGLVYAFNPVSIYMLNQVWFLYVYSAIPLVIYWFYAYFYEKENNFIGLFLCGLGTIALTSYTRFMLIYIIFLTIVGLFYYRDVRALWINKTRQCIIFVLFLFFANLPFVFSILYPHYSWENNYFSGVSNYASAFKDFGSVVYTQSKEIPLSRLIVPLEPTGNFGYPLSNNNTFIDFSFLYFSAVVFFLLYKQPHLHKKHTRLLSVWVSSIVLWILLRILPNYVSEHTFIYISYDLLPFLANNSAFSYRFILSGLSLLLPLSLSYASRIFRIAISLWAIVYCLSAASTLFFFHDNSKLHTIDISKNLSIADIFHTTGNDDNLSWYSEWSLLYPSSYLLFEWAPYPVSIGYIPWISPGIEWNERTTTPKKINFSRYLSQISILDKHIENLALLSLGSFVVIQHISNNPNKQQFDFYNDIDYLSQTRTADKNLIQNSWVDITTSNYLYRKYDIHDKNLFSFFVYLPQSIIFLSWYENILDTWIKLSDRPLLLDALSYNKPSYMHSGYTIPYITGQTIDIKTRKKTPFAYYIKISKVASWQDMVLQFNKTFGMNWKIKHIDKNIYNKATCTGAISYPLTHNTLCYMQWTFPHLYEFVDVLLSSTRYNNADHFEGNIIGNTRVIKNVTDIQDGDMYLLISNDKQYLFIISECIAVLVLSLCLLYGLFFLVRIHIWNASDT